MYINIKKTPASIYLLTKLFNREINNLLGEHICPFQSFFLELEKEFEEKGSDNFGFSIIFEK